MTSPIFIDTNLPTYAGGGPHVLRNPSIAVLGLVSDHPRAFWTDAEVLQELLHRYRSINRWSQGRFVFDNFVQLMRGRIEPVFAQDVQVAASLADRLARLDARDLLHLAVMARIGADILVSADRGFDRAPRIRRLDPAELAHWRQLVEG